MLAPDTAVGLNSKHMARETERGGDGGMERRRSFQGVADVMVNSSGCETIMRDQKKITGRAVFQPLLVLLTFHKKPTRKTKENMFLDGEIRHLQASFFFSATGDSFSIIHPPTHPIPPQVFLPLLSLSPSVSNVSLSATWVPLTTPLMWCIVSSW